MRLRLQLILVSLLALCLPWAGCTYIKDMETVLRQGQQQALLSTARAVAMTINARPELVDELVVAEEPERTGSTLYNHVFNGHAIADGYPDEWRNASDDFQNFSGRVNFYAATNAATTWLYFDVADTTVSYHNPSLPGIANGDYILLALIDNGATQYFWLTPEAPGELSARSLLGDQLITDSRIRGAWRDTDSGYQLELSLPAAMLGDRLGFAVVDSAAPGYWTGSMHPSGLPGKIIHQSVPLASVLQLFPQENLHLSVVDTEHWLRVSTGTPDRKSAATETGLSGTWLLGALYRWLMDAPSIASQYGTPRQGKLIREEILAALNGNNQAAWYTRGDGSDGAIVSAAFPVIRNETIVGAVVAEQTSDEVLSLTNTAMTRLLLITLVATLIIGFGLVAYASWLSFRIRRLSNNVTAVMTPDGSLSGKFPKQWGGDELGDLGRSFGELLSRVHEYTEYLRTLSSKLSHELRTPLAVVRSSLDNLEQTQTERQTRNTLDRARQGSARLSHILNAMSSASRVEESIESADKELLLLNDFLHSNVAGYRTAYSDQTIDLEITEQLLSIEASPELLAQMLDKLMDNAADFCPDEGRILFKLAERDGDAEITVSNDGPPLPEAMGMQLFDSMVSIRMNKDDKPHLGLGLTIVRLVVNFHQGSVAARNLENDAGVCFTITLPLSNSRTTT